MTGLFRCWVVRLTGLWPTSYVIYAFAYLMVPTHLSPSRCSNTCFQTYAFIRDVPTQSFEAATPVLSSIDVSGFGMTRNPVSSILNYPEITLISKLWWMNLRMKERSQELDAWIFVNHFGILNLWLFYVVKKLNEGKIVFLFCNLDALYF